MLVVEAKLKNGTPEQYHQLDEAIKTSQFVRNSCVHYWLKNKGTTRNDLQKLCAVLANNKDTPWLNKLNSQARQSAADRDWQSISRFYHNCRAKISGKKGFPRFKKHSRSVEYKLTGYRLSDDRRKIKFTDGFKAGEFDLWCSQKTLVYYSEQQIKRVRVVRRADGYYCQFLIDEAPKHHSKAKLSQSVKLQVILAEEENPHPGVNPISLLLLTSLDISSFESAITCVRWYSYRWLIERYHFVLKSGCGLEKLQLETGRRIEMALATYSIVAWRLLWLTYQSRLHGDESCESFLEEHEWQSLCVTIHKKSPPPEKPPKRSNHSDCFSWGVFR